MSIVKKKFHIGLNLRPGSPATNSAKGDLETLSIDGKAYYHDGSTSSPILTEAQSASITNKIIDADLNTISNIDDNEIKTLAGINATKIADGSVSNTEFQYLDGVTSPIQPQINGKVTGPGSATDEAIARFDGTSGALIQNSTVTITDAGVLSGPSQLNVDNLRLDGNTLSTTNTDGNLLLNPNGTGNVTVSTSLVVDNLTLDGNSISSTSNVVDITNNLRVEESLQTVQSVDSTTTGSDQDVPLPIVSYTVFTNASLTSIRSIGAGASGQQYILKNDTGSNLTVRNEDTGATAVNRILTGTGGDITVADDSSIELLYDNNASRWSLVGSVGGGLVRNDAGTRASPTNVSAGTTITINNLQRSLIYIQGNGGPVTMTANPQLTTAGISEFNELIIRGRSDANAVTLVNGNGLSLNGNKELGEDDSLYLIFDGTLWVES